MRALKLLLPAVAVVCFAVYGTALYVSSAITLDGLAVGSVKFDPTNLTMQDPRYSGFGKDGSEYKVHAKTAVTDLGMSKPVRLDVIDGEIIQPTGVVTRLNAKWGTYDQKKDLLELYDEIDVTASNGLKARLTRATVLAKESRVSSPEPVWAETETGQIRAASMTLDTKARKAAFRQDVEVTLKPRSPTAEGGNAAAAERLAPAFGIDANSEEPVIVTSRELDVDDTGKIATFRDSVVARQGGATLEAPKLDVIYVGSGGPAAGGGTADEPRGEVADPGQRLKTIKAQGGVVMTSRGDRAESETLEYQADTEQVTLAGNVVMTQQPDRKVTAETVVLDQQADTARLSGDVVVVQGRNMMRGGLLSIDRKAGTARLTTPGEAWTPAGRISTTLYQGQAAENPASARAKAGVRDADENPGPFGAAFRADPNAPIEVEAAKLEVDDRKHTAVYIGDVVAKQGELVVKSEELTAHYAGHTGLLAGQPTAATERANGVASELKRIEARRNVVVTATDGQQATGDWATFDVKSNKIVMGGSVALKQGKQLVQAPEGKLIVYDLNTGIMGVESEPSPAPAKAGPQVSGAFATTASTVDALGRADCPPGVICRRGSRFNATFYPHLLKEKGRQKADEAAAAAETVAPGSVETGKALARQKAREAEAAAREIAPGITDKVTRSVTGAASSWTSTTTKPDGR